MDAAEPAPADSKKGIFISYTQSDSEWAEWIAWTLDEAGCTTIIQAWDCPPGLDFRAFIKQATKESRKTIAILSEEYHASHWTSLEWIPPFEADPDGRLGLLATVRVRSYKPYGHLSERNYVDLVGLDEERARARLLEAFKPDDGNDGSPARPADAKDRHKPKNPPPFPGQPEEDEDDAPEPAFGFWPRLVSAWFWLICVGLLSLSASYFMGSRVCQGSDGAFWDRLFNGFGKPRAELTGFGFGLGYLIEMVRLVVLQTVALIFMPGYAFKEAAARLMTETPLRKLVGAEGVPRQGAAAWETRIGFGVFVALGVFLLMMVIGHHVITGPEYLWKSQGLSKFELNARESAQKDEGSPGGRAKNGETPLWSNHKYLRTCLLPYLTYLVYSIINFPIAVNVIFTITSFALITDLMWMYLWPNWFKAEFKQGKITGSDLRRFFKRDFLNRLARVLERYYCLFTFLAAGLAFMVWLDSVNVTPEAHSEELEALLIATSPLILLMPLSTVFYAGAREAVAKRSSNPNAFVRDHPLANFYVRSIIRSKYSLVSGLALMSVVVHYFVFGWAAS
jgi:hypothetical protein